MLKRRGVSYVKYELVRTYVGAVADVEIDRTTGKVRVPRFYLVQDCGQIINPDGVKSQLDGNVIQTVSRTLIEGSEMGSLDGHDTRLGELSDHHIPRGAGASLRSD